MDFSVSLTLNVKMSLYLFVILTVIESYFIR